MIKVKNLKALEAPLNGVMGDCWRCEKRKPLFLYLESDTFHWLFCAECASEAV